MPGYLYYNYLGDLPNLIQTSDRPKSGLDKHHYDVEAPEVLIRSHQAIKQYYSNYLLNLKKYQHLSKEDLNDPVIHYLLYFCQEAFQNMTCISQYGGRYDVLFILAGCLKLSIHCEPLTAGAG